MNTSKHISSIALFPLCDARSVLMDALRDSSQSTGTRGDALVFAWRLALPASMDVGHAANAVLLTALSSQRDSWSRSQLLIIRELMVLAGRAEALPTDDTKKPTRKPISDPSRSSRKSVLGRKAVDSTAKPAASSKSHLSQAKQDKDWWKLVGQSVAKDKPVTGRRSTERSLRET